MKKNSIILESLAVMLTIGMFAVSMVGCSNDSNETKELEQIPLQKRERENENKNKKEKKALVSEFENVIHDIMPSLKQIIESKGFKENPDLYRADLEVAIMPLVGVSEELLGTLNISEEELPVLFGEIPLSNSQIVGIGMLVYTQQVSINGGDVLECAASALVGISLHEGFWSSFTTRKAMLKAIGKIASRYLGVIGAAMIVYDFAECMWG